MTYSKAQTDAASAASSAKNARSMTDDRAIAELSAAVESLSKAVGEIARQLKLAR